MEWQEIEVVCVADRFFFAMFLWVDTDCGQIWDGLCCSVTVGRGILGPGPATGTGLLPPPPPHAAPAAQHRSAARQNGAHFAPNLPVPYTCSCAQILGIK